MWGTYQVRRRRGLSETARAFTRARLANRLGDAPGEFPTYKQRINLTPTIFTHADYIPKPSEAPLAVDSAESCCSRSVGSWDGSSLRPWRRPQLAANPHPRPPFTTTAALTASSMYQGIHCISLVRTVYSTRPPRPSARRRLRRSLPRSPSIRQRQAPRAMPQEHHSTSG